MPWPPHEYLPVPVLDRLAAAVTGGHQPRSPAGLLAVFRQVQDPRGRRGRRHSLAVVLTLVTCAVLAGARSFTAIDAWSADAGQTVSDLPGIVRIPDESTFRRVFAALDADALDSALGAWAVAATTPAAGTPRRLAVDGKTLRGSARASVRVATCSPRSTTPVACDQVIYAQLAALP
ncbi:MULTISPECIES: transposase family protein [unclassified Frankia]|uniref:transposase family protein n=1 Tax=unclassified Frankia TaxID=2632575 RepID=UPI001EF57CF0|nr:MULTISPECIES: transposase family protein [unclassified Frankia]